MRNSAFAGLLFSLLLAVPVAASATETSSSQSAKPASVQAVPAPAAAQGVMVNINTADEQTLSRELNGIGEVKAKAIVAHREANGPFTSVDELREVKGIGAATLDKNRARLSVN